MKSIVVFSALFLQAFFGLTFATEPYHQCQAGSYCNGDVDAIRGVAFDADTCFSACSGVPGMNYNYFDVTSDGQCWCGDVCDSLVPFQTTFYSMNSGWCPTESPTLAPTDHPTTAPSAAPTEHPTTAPSAAPTTLAPSETPSFRPTEAPSQSPTMAPYTLCSTGLYCSGDIRAVRGIYTTAQQCYDSCNAVVGKTYKFFDVTSAGQCWCGETCDSFTAYPTLGYRMNEGVCPPGTHTAFDGLVAKYNFNNGNANDLIGNNNPTTNTATLTTDRFQNANSAYSFNGNGNYISIPGENFDFASDMSISFWVKPAATQQNVWATIFDKSHSTIQNQYTGGWLFTQVGNANPHNNIYAYNYQPVGWGNIVDGTWTTKFALSSSSWSHVVVVKSSVAISYYVNNVFVIQFSISEAPKELIANHNPLTFGAGNTWAGISDHWAGSLDDIYFFNRAITTAEIATLYNEPSP